MNLSVGFLCFNYLRCPSIQSIVETVSYIANISSHHTDIDAPLLAQRAILGLYQWPLDVHLSTWTIDFLTCTVMGECTDLEKCILRLVRLKQMPLGVMWAVQLC